MRDLPVLCIVDSSFRAARKLARHLIAQGHTRIAFINCHTPDALNPEKFAGFEAAMHEKGLEVDPELVAVPPHYLPNEELQKFIDKFIGKILALPNPPTALFAFNDLRALMATKSLQARGINIGTDFAVAGFGDGAIRQRLCDWLTSSRIQVRKIGEDGLRAALSGRNLTEGRTIVVPNRLIIRASTMPIGRTGARKPVTQLVVAHV
jgi:DNA-binding LacI/PurR family transcriptional regulator